VAQPSRSPPQGTMLRLVLWTQPRTPAMKQSTPQPAKTKRTHGSRAP